SQRLVWDYGTVGRGAAMPAAAVNRWNAATVVAASVVRRERCDPAGAGAGGVTVSTAPASRRRAGAFPGSKRRPGSSLASFLTVGGGGFPRRVTHHRRRGRGQAGECPCW